MHYGLIKENLKESSIIVNWSQEAKGTARFKEQEQTSARLFLV